MGKVTVIATAGAVLILSTGVGFVCSVGSVGSVGLLSGDKTGRATEGTGKSCWLRKSCLTESR